MYFVIEEFFCVILLYGLFMQAPTKKSKGKTVDTVDGVDTAKMNREQLELYAQKILKEMEREREERNFFQLERDKLRTFWEITRQQLTEAKAAVRYITHTHRVINYFINNLDIKLNVEKKETRKGKRRN